MPRIGNNPLRNQKIPNKLPPSIPVVCIITHLPDETGYHEKRLEIVTKSIMMAVKNAGHPAYWMVWDNGSCGALRDYLHFIGLDLFVQSANVGKLNAVGTVLRMFPGSIVGISDDDMIYYPGWLDIQVKTLLAHKAALVSGATTKFHMKLQHGGDEEPDNDFPIAWDLDFGRSLGHDDKIIHEIHNNYTARYRTADGIRAYRGGAHCQFVCHADTIAPYCKPTNRYMEPLAPFDRALEADGVLRLLTSPRTSRHIGNTMTDYDRREIEALLR